MPEHPEITDADLDELVAYLDGELDAAGQQRVETRLSLEPKVRAEVDALKKTWEMLDYLPRAEPTAEFSTRTIEAVSALRPARPGRHVPQWARPGAWAAAVVAAGVLGYLLAGARAPKPAAAIELENDPLYTQNPRVVAHLPLYQAAGTLDYLNALDTPDLFGEEAPAR
jgi:anti-sigma factor RsiW